MLKPRNKQVSTQKQSRLLSAVKTKPDSLEQALVWRSQGYLVWAQGHSKHAIDLLDKALRSNQLSAEQAAEDRLNLAELSFSVKKHAASTAVLTRRCRNR